MLFPIKNRFTSEIIFTAKIEATESTPESIKTGLAVKQALKSGADLSSADLSGADLSRADLSRAYLYGANMYGVDLTGSILSGADLTLTNLSGAILSRTILIDGGQRSDGHRFVGFVNDGVIRLRAGCWDFTLPEARQHWLATRGGTPLGQESLDIVDHIARLARIRGLVDNDQ